MITLPSIRGRLLIVDDEPSVRRALQGTLRDLGFDVVSTANAQQAIEAAKRIRYDVVLLDTSTPEVGVVAACLELRRLLPQIGILILTVNADCETKVEALDAGADDYVTKPCHMAELAARLRSLIRRSRSTESKSGLVIKIGEIKLDSARRTVHRGARALRLTPKEFELLYYLMTNAGFPMTHAQLLSAVWGPEYASQVEYLRTFVRQLRSKLGDSASHSRYLFTETQVGYRFRSVNESIDEDAEGPFVDQGIS